MTLGPDLSVHRAHVSHCLFCHEAAHMFDNCLYDFNECGLLQLG